MTTLESPACKQVPRNVHLKNTVAGRSPDRYDGLLENMLGARYRANNSFGNREKAVPALIAQRLLGYHHYLCGRYFAALPLPAMSCYLAYPST